MKKYILSALFTLSVAQADCQAQPTIEKDDQNINVPTRLLEVIDYFENEKLEINQLKELSEISYLYNSTFIETAHKALRRKPTMRNESIVAHFIQTGAQTIINSDEYSWENTKLFNLVEELDPILRGYWRLAGNN